MRLFDCLPNEIAVRLQSVDDLRELRVRDGCPVKLNAAGHWYYIADNGAFVTSSRLAFAVGKVCDGIVKKACASSIYAYEKSLANGYFTLDDGVRIGVCGHLFGADKPVFRQYTSLCFRIPHNVNCVNDDTLQSCLDNNTVIIGAPGSGKTTYLRDIAVKLGVKYNVLVADERGELFYDDNLMRSGNCDVLKWCDKRYAFEIGARSMSPQYFICDELSESDAVFVRSCASSGIKLICSAHAANDTDFQSRFGLLDLFGQVVDLNKRVI